MSLTDKDLVRIRAVVRDEVQGVVFGKSGLQRLRAIVHDEVQIAFESRGRQIVREELMIAMAPFEGKITAAEADSVELYDITTKQGREMRRQIRRAKKRLDRLELNTGLPAMKF